MNRYPLRYVKFCPFCGKQNFERVRFCDLYCPQCHVVFAITHGSDRVHGEKVIGDVNYGMYKSRTPDSRTNSRLADLKDQLTAVAAERERLYDECFEQVRKVAAVEKERDRLAELLLDSLKGRIKLEYGWDQSELRYGYWFIHEHGNTHGSYETIEDAIAAAKEKMP